MQIHADQNANERFIKSKRIRGRDYGAAMYKIM
jgi:hypothetical protein